MGLLTKKKKMQDFKVVFDLRALATTSDLLVFNSPSGAISQARVKITSPIGLVIKDFAVAPAWDIDAPNGVVDGSVAIPVAGPDYLVGTYIIEVQDWTTGTQVDTTYEGYFCGPKTGFDFTISINCLTAKGLVVDTTTYPGTEEFLTKFISANAGSIPNLPPSTPVTTTTSPTLEFPVTHTGVSYAATVDITYIWYDDRWPWLCVAEQWSLSKTVTSDCVNICKVLSCINQKIKEILAMSQKCGGIDRLPVNIKDKLTSGISYLQIYNSAVACVDYTLASTAIENAADAFGISCCNDGGVEEITPACPGASPIDVVGSSPITVNFTGGQWVVGFNSSFIAEVVAGTGININNPTGPIVTIENTGVLSLGVTAGSGLGNTGTAQNPILNFNPSVLFTEEVLPNFIGVGEPYQLSPLFSNVVQPGNYNQLKRRTFIWSAVEIFGVVNVTANIAAGTTVDFADIQLASRIPRSWPVYKAGVNGTPVAYIFTGLLTNDAKINLLSMANLFTADTLVVYGKFEAL